MILWNNLLLSSCFRFSSNNPSSTAVYPFCIFTSVFEALENEMIFNQISRPLIIIRFRIMNCVHLIITSYLPVISKWIRDHHRIFRALQDGLWLLKKNLQVSPSSLKHSRKTCNVSLLLILYLARLLLVNPPPPPRPQITWTLKILCSYGFKKKLIKIEPQIFYEWNNSCTEEYLLYVFIFMSF